MNILPTDLQNIIMDYKYQMEKSAHQEKYDSVMFELTNYGNEIVDPADFDILLHENDVLYSRTTSILSRVRLIRYFFYGDLYLDDITNHTFTII